MRVTNRMLSRNYVKTLQDNIYRVANTQQQITSNHKYQNLSDNVTDCSRALRADQQVRAITRQLKGIDYASGELDAANDTLDNMSSLFIDAYSELTDAVNMLGKEDGAIDKTKLGAITDLVSNLKKELLQLSNSQFAGKYQFSGANGTTPPYAVDNGVLKYNGVPVDDIQKDPATGDYFYMFDKGDGSEPVRKDIPRDEDVYLDIGRGLKMSGNQVDPATAFKISFSGLDVLGFGTTKDGETGFEMSNNLFGALDQVEHVLMQLTGKEEGTVPVEELSTQLTALHSHMKERHNSVVSSLTELGGRVDFLERTSERLTDQVNTLENLKTSLVGMDTTDGTAAKELADHMYAYNATLQLGATLFQTSLLDFLRV